MRNGLTTLIAVLVVLGWLASLAEVYSPSFPVWVLSNSDFDFEGSHFEEKSGNAQVSCDHWEDYHYMYGGSGYIYSGSGSGCFGMSNYWYTDEGELTGGTRATISFECSYYESGDDPGTSSAFVRAYFFVYKEQDGGWVCVGSDDVTEPSYWAGYPCHELTVTHSFTSSKYKFRFLGRAEFSSASVTCSVPNMEVNNGTIQIHRWIKVFND